MIVSAAEVVKEAPLASERSLAVRLPDVRVTEALAPINASSPLTSSDPPFKVRVAAPPADPSSVRPAPDSTPPASTSVPFPVVV